MNHTNHPTTLRLYRNQTLILEEEHSNGADAVASAKSNGETGDKVILLSVIGRNRYSWHYTVTRDGGVKLDQEVKAPVREGKV